MNLIMFRTLPNDLYLSPHGSTFREVRNHHRPSDLRGQHYSYSTSRRPPSPQYRCPACSMFGHPALSSEIYNALNTKFVAPVGTLRKYKITIRKLRQFQNSQFIKNVGKIIFVCEKIKIYLLGKCSNFGQSVLNLGTLP